MKELLFSTDDGLRTIVFPHEKVLEEIRTHHFELFQELRGFSLKAPKQGIHLTVVQAKNKIAYDLLIDVLGEINVGYDLLSPKGKIISPPVAA